MVGDRGGAQQVDMRQGKVEYGKYSLVTRKKKEKKKEAKDCSTMIDEWRSERVRTLELEQGSDRRGGGAVSQTHALNLTIRLRTLKKVT